MEDKRKLLKPPHSLTSRGKQKERKKKLLLDPKWKNWGQTFWGLPVFWPKIVYLLRNMCFPQNVSAGKSEIPFPFPWEQAGGDNPAVSIQAEGREAGQSWGSSEGQPPALCRGRGAAGPGQPRAVWLWTFKQPLALLLFAATGKWVSKTRPAVVRLGWQRHVQQRRKLQPYWYRFSWLKHHLPPLYLCTDSPSMFISLYGKHRGLEKFILTAVCQNISLLH